MIRKGVFLLALFLITLSTQAQSIKNINWVRDSTKIVLYYDLVSFIKGNSFNVEVFCSTDGGETFNIPVKSVIGDLGNDINLGRKKVLVWDVFKDVGGLAGNVTFRIVAEKNPRKRDYFVAYNGSLEAPFGIMVGMLGGVSPYGALRMNKEFNEKNEYVYDENSLIIDYPYKDIYFIYGDEVKKPRFSLTAGVTAQVFNNAYAYAGAGYGKSLLLWEVNEYKYSDDMETDQSWAVNNTWSIKGLELEGGLILPLKSVLITAGGSVVNFRRPTLTFGIGYKFN